MRGLVDIIGTGMRDEEIRRLYEECYGTMVAYETHSVTPGCSTVKDVGDILH